MAGSEIAETNAARGGGESVVHLGRRIEIYPEARLPALSRPGLDAYHARRNDQRKADLLALIGSDDVPMRLEILPMLRGIEHPNLLAPTDWGRVAWPDGRARFAVLYDQPPGPLLLRELEHTRDPMNEEDLVRQVVAPLTAALRELAARGVFHGGIRPTNIYMGLAGSTAVLGECVSKPPSYDQGALFEPIERALCQPAGRGPGTNADDLYALGVTLVILALGANPMAGMSEEEIIDAKLEKGSYPAIVGKARLPNALMELVRGLLTDDRKERWSLNDVVLWLSGRRLSPKQVHLARRAVRPITFAGQEHLRPQTLAVAMAKNITEAVGVIESGELDKWLRRSAMDEACADLVKQAVETASSGGRAGGFDDRLVARVCIALDPAAPIRYRGISLLPTGLGDALAEAVMKGDGTAQTIAEILQSSLAVFWFNAQPEFKTDFMALVKQFDSAREKLGRNLMGFGLERAMYELSPSSPCRSEMMAAHLPLTGDDFLAALDDIAATADRPSLPMDRHAAAFLAARDKKVSEPQLALIGNAPGPQERALALLSILANLQSRVGPAEVPALSRWMVELLQPVVERFKSRDARVRVQQALEDAGQRGDLSLLQRIVDDPKLLSRDQSGFEKARSEFIERERAIRGLQREIGNRRKLERSSGREVAAMVAGFGSVAILTGIVISALPLL
jgi:hypothetical protein